MLFMNVGSVLPWSTACVVIPPLVFKSIFELLGGARDSFGRIRGDLSKDDGGDHRL